MLWRWWMRVKGAAEGLPPEDVTVATYGLQLVAKALLSRKRGRPVNLPVPDPATMCAMYDAVTYLIGATQQDWKEFPILDRHPDRLAPDLRLPAGTRVAGRPADIWKHPTRRVAIAAIAAHSGISEKQVARQLRGHIQGATLPKSS